MKYYFFIKMPKCVNIPKNGKILYYTGNEKTPRGNGYAEIYEKDGTIKKGKFDNYYVSKGNRWMMLVRKTSPRGFTREGRIWKEEDRDTGEIFIHDNGRNYMTGKVNYESGFLSFHPPDRKLVVVETTIRWEEVPGYENEGELEEFEPGYTISNVEYLKDYEEIKKELIEKTKQVWWRV